MRPFPRRLVWSSSLLTGLTGVIHFWMEHALEPAQPWAVINHPLQPWVLKAHILVAPVMVFAIGLVAVDHIWRHFRQKVRPGRRSGVLAMAVFGPLVVSGYLIQAVTHAGWLFAIVAAHVVTGGLYLVALVGHHRVFRRASPPRRGESPPRRAVFGSAPSSPRRPSRARTDV